MTIRRVLMTGCATVLGAYAGIAAFVAIAAAAAADAGMAAGLGLSALLCGMAARSLLLKRMANERWFSRPDLTGEMFNPSTGLPMADGVVDVSGSLYLARQAETFGDGQ